MEVGLCAPAMMSAASACSLGPQMSSAACSGGAELAPAGGAALAAPSGGGATMVLSSAAVWYAVSPDPELGSWAARAAAAYASGSAHCLCASSRVCGLQQASGHRAQQDLCSATYWRAYFSSLL